MADAAAEPVPATRSMREVIARAVYRVRPFRVAEPGGVMDGCLSVSREMSWDGAPSFYRSECFEIADAAILDMVLAQQGEFR